MPNRRTAPGLDHRSAWGLGRKAVCLDGPWAGRGRGGECRQSQDRTLEGPTTGPGARPQITPSSRTHAQHTSKHASQHTVCRHHDLAHETQRRPHCTPLRTSHQVYVRKWRVAPRAAVPTCHGCTLLPEHVHESPFSSPGPGGRKRSRVPACCEPPQQPTVRYPCTVEALHAAAQSPIWSTITSITSPSSMSRPAGVSDECTV